MTSLCTVANTALKRKAAIQVSAVVFGIVIAFGFATAVMAGLMSLQVAVEPLPAMLGADAPPGPFTVIGVLTAYVGSLWLGMRVARLLVSPVVNKLRFW